MTPVSRSGGVRRWRRSGARGPAARCVPAVVRPEPIVACGLARLRCWDGRRCVAPGYVAVSRAYPRLAALLDGFARSAQRPNALSDSADDGAQSRRCDADRGRLSSQILVSQLVDPGRDGAGRLRAVRDASSARQLDAPVRAAGRWRSPQTVAGDARRSSDCLAPTARPAATSCSRSPSGCSARPARPTSS